MPLRGGQCAFGAGPVLPGARISQRSLLWTHRHFHLVLLWAFFDDLWFDAAGVQPIV